MKLFLLSLLCLNTFAMDIYVGGGLLLNSADIKNVNDDFIETEVTLQAGAKAVLGLNEKLALRSGLFYTAKSFSLKGNNSAELTLSYTYLTVPLTLQYKLDEKIALFGGFNAQINVGDDCEVTGGSCEADNVESFVSPFVIGGSMKLSPLLSLELSYEKAIGDTVGAGTDIKIDSLVFNVFYSI